MFSFSSHRVSLPRSVVIFMTAVVIAMGAALLNGAVYTQSAYAQSPTRSSPEISAVGEGEAQAEGGDASVRSGGGKMALILDASSSMLQDDIGETRMDAAKKATHDVVESLPETINMGLIAYGARESDAADNRVAGCQDIEVLSPIQRIDKQALLQKVDGLSPRGYTPMGNSLRKAAEVLGSEGERSIILVSDGIDTCAPPAVCDVAKELAAQGVGLSIHTVGFRVDDAARAELECIAAAGNGQFLEAEDAASLVDSLKYLAQRDAAQFEATGTPFEYADSPTEAKWLGEGLYTTAVRPGDYEGDPQLHYFRVAVPEGHRAIVTSLPVLRRSAMGEALGFDNSMSSTVNVDHVEVFNESGGSSCQSNRALIGGSANLLGLRAPTAAKTVLADSAGSDCDPEEWVFGTAVRFAAVSGTLQDEVDIQVFIQFEPIADGSRTATVDPSSLGGEPADLPMGHMRDIQPGTSYLDAVEVQPGAYRQSIVPGETFFYKLPIAWGQRPVVTLRSGAPVREGNQSIAAAIVDPFFYAAGKGDIDFHEANKTDTFTISSPVKYSDVAAYAGGTTQAGYYYVAVTLGTGLHGDVMGVDQPFSIAFDVQGEQLPGPEWRPVYKLGPAPADAAPSTVVSETENPQPVDSAAPAGAAEDDGGFFGGRPGMLVAVSVGIGVLLMLLLALIVLRRR